MEPTATWSFGNEYDLTRIVCLIGGRAHHLYFVNRIHRAYKVDLLISQTTHIQGFRGLRDRLRSSFARGSLAPFRARLPVKVRNRSETRLYDRMFGSDWHDLDPSIPLMLTNTINGTEVKQRLRKLKPDLLLVHGTALLRDNILQTASHTINLHWGLSPYYRGTNCTDWALLLWDIQNIGVTLHRLSQRIDGGDIIAQARAALTPEDDVYSINMQLTKRGTDLMLRVLDAFIAGRKVQFVQQDLSRGYLTLNRHWSKRLRRHLQVMIRRGAVKRMIAHPARPPLPIVDFGD